jgi:hypothetical protein
MMIHIMRTREEGGRTGVTSDPSVFMRARWPLGDLSAVFHGLLSFHALVDDVRRS